MLSKSRDRAHAFFEVSPTALLIVAMIGGLTAIFAASIAVFSRIARLGEKISRSLFNGPQTPASNRSAA